MIDALFFDIGNVLVTFDFTRCSRKLAGQSPLAPDDIAAQIAAFVPEMEWGRWSSGEFVRRCMEAIRFGGSEEEFIEAYTNIFAENTPMTALVPRLAERCPLYLLSNTGGIHLDFLRRTYPVFQHFKGGAFSHESASMKPDAEIYRDVIALSGCDPARVLYLDDVAANTDAGAALGLQTFTYDWRQHAAFEDVLKNRGILP